MYECPVYPPDPTASFPDWARIPTEGEEAFLELWEADVIRAARRSVLLRRSSWPAADDVAQDVRIRLCRAFRAVEPTEGYARRVIQNAVLNSTRRNDRFVSTTTDDGTRVHPEPSVEPPNVLIQSVRRWVAKQPTRLARLYQLLYVIGVTQREAARQMRLSQPRVAQLHRQLLEAGRRDLATLAA
jgi:RNA polymerase sigma factor (sigma-70 family)